MSSPQSKYCTSNSPGATSLHLKYQAAARVRQELSVLCAELGKRVRRKVGVAVGRSANAIAVRQVGLSGVVVLPVEVACVERPDEGAPQTHCVGVLGLDEGRLGVVVSDPVGAVGHEWSLVAGVPRDLPLQRLRLGQEVGEHGVPLVLGHLVVAPEGALVREGAGGQGADGGAVGAVVLRVGQKEAAAVRRDSQNHLLGNAAQREP